MAIAPKYTDNQVDLDGGDGMDGELMDGNTGDVAQGGEKKNNGPVSSLLSLLKVSSNEPEPIIDDFDTNTNNNNSPMNQQGNPNGDILGFGGSSSSNANDIMGRGGFVDDSGAGGNMSGF